jgi:CHAT domain-containing protein/predicted negative regulator of RcsB-dependent stress response
MSFAFRVSLCLLALSLSLINPALAQTQSVPNTHTSSEINDLAAALGAAASEEEQDRLLARKPDLMNSSLLAALKALADTLSRKGDFAQALRISQLEVRIGERMGDRVALGAALCDLGFTYFRQNGLAQALDRFQKGLVIFEEAGDKKGKAYALLGIGSVYFNQRRFDQTFDHFEKGLALSEEVGDRGLTMWILGGLGGAHTALGRHELGLEMLLKSRAISEELNEKEALIVATNNIANLYTVYGRYTDALEYLHKDLKILEELGYNGDKRSLAIRLMNIARIYSRQGDADQALENYRKSLKLFEELDNDKLAIAVLHNRFGSIYRSQGHYEQALEWFHKSLRILEEVQAKSDVVMCLTNIGDVYRLQGRYDQALEYLRKSLLLREEIKDRREISVTLNSLGRLYQDQGRYAETLDVSRRAAKLAEENNEREGLWNAQERIGSALLALGQPVEARRSFLAAISTIESLRHDVAGGGQQQQSFLENKLSPWLGMIALLVSQKEHAEALTFAEQSKARVLLDALQAGRASLRGSLSPQERQTEEEQRHRLVSLNSQLTSELQRGKPDQTRVADLKAGVEKARLEYEALETSLYVAHPELKVHRGEASIINAEELNALLPEPTSALIEYVVADDQTYLFAITKAAGQTETVVQVYTIPIKRAELAKQTESFRRQIAGRDLGFRASARKLYDLLLKPAQASLRGKSSLVIVPDDKLWELPFQALLSEDGRYVIERSDVSYVPSLTVLREMKAKRNRRKAEPAGPALLALGNPALGKETIERAALTLRDEKLIPLPEAEIEVKELSRLYGRSRSKVYVGAEAREDRVKIEAGQVRILHFATHGILNNGSPMYSHLVLARGDKNEDGLLEAWELMRLDLRADLAVLSACETARGRFGAGEGMIGLSWALFVAGVPSTVVSQWKVESTSTRDLMLSFHRQLRRPLTPVEAMATKAEALRQAALKLMKNPQTSHPFYWAGFVLVGDGGSGATPRP